MKTKELEKSAQAAGLVKGTSSDPVRGVEGLSGKHLSVASVVLVQGVSKHFIEKGILPGRFASTLTETEIKDTEFVPAYMTEKLFVYSYSDPECRKKKFEFVATSDADPRIDGKRTNWEDGMKPEVIPTIILAAIMNGKPVKIKFQGASGYPAGRKLWSFAYDAAKESGDALWDSKYKLVAAPRQNQKGDNFYAFDIVKVGTPSDSDKAEAILLFEAFKVQASKQAEEIEEVPF